MPLHSTEQPESSVSRFHTPVRRAACGATAALPGAGIAFTAGGGLLLLTACGRLPLFAAGAEGLLLLTAGGRLPLLTADGGGLLLLTAGAGRPLLLLLLPLPVASDGFCCTPPIAALRNCRAGSDPAACSTCTGHHPQREARQY